MNCANRTIAIVLSPILLLAAEPTAKDWIGMEGNPPWKPEKNYNVRSTYEMELRDIVLDVRLYRKEHRLWGFLWTVDEKEKSHATSRPFSGKYTCQLDYSTYGALFETPQRGSVFRDYASASIAFQPEGDGRMILVDADPSWFRSLFFDPRTKTYAKEDVEEMLEDKNADFMFRDIFMTGGRYLDADSLYFLQWRSLDELKPNRNRHMAVYKKPKRDFNSDLGIAARLDGQSRSKIELGTVGGCPEEGWVRVLGDDLGYQVAQAEAKLMTYCIYGQSETRNVGDVWDIEAETLESFFPLQEKSRKPFTFSGGLLFLTVVSDKNGIVTVESLSSGLVNGSTTPTNLKVTPNTEANELKPSFRIDMTDVRHNKIRFSIDSRAEICTKAEMWLALEDYKGALPKMEQLSLSEVDPEKQRLEAKIDGGRIGLHAVITTTVRELEGRAP